MNQIFVPNIYVTSHFVIYTHKDTHKKLRKKHTAERLRYPDHKLTLKLSTSTTKSQFENFRLLL